MGQGGAEGFEPLIAFDRFGQEGEGPVGERHAAEILISAAAVNDHWKLGVGITQAHLQREAVDVRHDEVQDEALGAVDTAGNDEVGHAGMRFGGEAEGLEQRGQGIAERLVVIHDGDTNFVGAIRHGKLRLKQCRSDALKCSQAPATPIPLR